MELVAHKQLTIGRQTYQAGEHFAIQDYFGRQLLQAGKAYEAIVPTVQLNTGLVSCIMPTKDRAAWIPRALECWQAQTYQPLQLVIIDNGAQPIKDLLPTDSRIVYTRTGQNMKLGMLRNLACSISTGEYIAHWDDDDWYSPDRIERQMEAIVGYQVCGMGDCLFHEPGTTRRYTAPPPHAIGASLLYRREWWLKNRFVSDFHVGEDAHFWTKAAGNSVKISGEGLMVASIHDANTSPRAAKNEWRLGGKLPQGYRWI